MITRRPLTQLAKLLVDKFSISEKYTVKEIAEVIQDWFDVDQSDYTLKENTNYYVCKLSSTNHYHCSTIIEGRGFSFLKKGDAFDFSLEGFHRARGDGAIYKATSDFKNGKIHADKVYDPEI